MKLVLGNEDYLTHMSDEGRQLQEGLVHAGWTMVYASGERDVRRVVDFFKPTHVFIQDVRDWDPKSPISKRRDLGFESLEVLRDPAIRVSTVMKDAWGWQDLQREWYERAGVQDVLHYYAADVITLDQCSPWLSDYTLHRIYHSVDAKLCMQVVMRNLPRGRGITSGARGNFYPLRKQIWKMASALRIAKLHHQGHHNAGAATPDYLRTLGCYKVHVFTGGYLQVAFRKHMESVAVGCVPITTLADDDVLPVIDDALHRIPQDERALATLCEVIDSHEAAWRAEERAALAQRCWGYYDWRVAGLRIDRQLTA